jgi:hypothetical protein
MDPSDEEIQERIDMLAAGEMPAAVAIRFGRSVGTIYNFASRYKDQIADRKEELYGEIHRKTADHWISDVVKSTGVREALAEDTIERRADPNLDPRDVSKYTRDIDMLIHRSLEAAGLLPQRVQAQVAVTPITNCIVGFSCECGEGCDQVKPWPGSESKPAPEPVHDSRSSPVSPPLSVPAEYAGSEAIARELERGALAIVDALKHRAVMHRDEILRLMPGDNTRAKPPSGIRR